MPVKPSKTKACRAMGPIGPKALVIGLVEENGWNCGTVWRRREQKDRSFDSPYSWTLCVQRSEHYRLRSQQILGLCGYSIGVSSRTKAGSEAVPKILNGCIV